MELEERFSIAVEALRRAASGRIAVGADEIKRVLDYVLSTPRKEL